MSKYQKRPQVGSYHVTTLKGYVALIYLIRGYSAGMYPSGIVPDNRPDLVRPECLGLKNRCHRGQQQQHDMLACGFAPS